MMSKLALNMGLLTVMIAVTAMAPAKQPNTEPPTATIEADLTQFKMNNGYGDPIIGTADVDPRGPVKCYFQSLDGELPAKGSIFEVKSHQWVFDQLPNWGEQPVGEYFELEGDRAISCLCVAQWSTDDHDYYSCYLPPDAVKKALHGIVRFTWPVTN